MKDYLNKNYLLKRLLFVLVDLFSVFVSMYGALLVLDNFTFGDTGMDKLLTPVFHSLFINMALTVGVFLLFRLYNSVWTHVSIVEMYNVILGCFSTVLISFVWNGTADTLIGKNVFFVTAGYYVIYFFLGFFHSNSI